MTMIKEHRFCKCGHGDHWHNHNKWHNHCDYKTDEEYCDCNEFEEVFKDD